MGRTIITQHRCLKIVQEISAILNSPESEKVLSKAERLLLLDTIRLMYSTHDKVGFTNEDNRFRNQSLAQEKRWAKKKGYL